MIIFLATILGLIPLYIDRDSESTPEVNGDHALPGLAWIEEIPVPPGER